MREVGNINSQRSFNQDDAIIQEDEKENCPDVIFLYENSCVTYTGESTSLIFNCYCNRRGPNMTIYICILPDITVLNSNTDAEK